MRKMTLWYTIYDADTDDLIACGSARDCANIMGTSVSNIHSLISRVKSGYNRKYTIVREDLAEGTYEVYNPDPPS